ncbi:hypothetical protein GCM10023159_16780 [Brevibacterium yomogidense]
MFVDPVLRERIGETANGTRTEIDCRCHVSAPTVGLAGRVERVGLAGRVERVGLAGRVERVGRAELVSGVELMGRVGFSGWDWRGSPAHTDVRCVTGNPMNAADAGKAQVFADERAGKVHGRRRLPREREEGHPGGVLRMLGSRGCGAEVRSPNS